MPAISVLCPTYGRPGLLAEAIESFLRQTYQDAEMIVLNDRADQTLAFEHPRVRIVNQVERCGSVGEKRRQLATLSSAKFICHWDDDDVYLPGFLQGVVDRVPRYLKGKLSRLPYEWLDSGGRLYRIRPEAYVHTMLIERDTYWSIGGHDCVNRNEDLSLLRKARAAGLCYGPPAVFERPQFIFRHETGRAHMSTFFPGTGHNTERYELFAKESAEQSHPGVYEIEPAWHSDYAAKAEASWQAVCEASKRPLTDQR